uniref:Uncharacterized protein n=1 Tax=Rhizophora mucronata TaxID=61149 RepID=A0A2P2PAX5_RHIMU
MPVICYLGKSNMKISPLKSNSKQLLLAQEG